MQEEPIKEEEEELAKMKDSVSSQKGVTLEEMSHPTAKEAQEQAIPKALEKYEQLCELSRAYPLAKTSASSVSQGCREFLKLANKILMAIATSFTPSIMIAAEYNLFLASSLDLCFSEVPSLDVFHDELQAKHPPHSLVFSRISSLHMGNYKPKILTRRPANQPFCTQSNWRSLFERVCYKGRDKCSGLF